MILTTTATTFDADVLSGSQVGPVLVDFWAPWCGPCRAVTPILDKISQDYPKLRIAKVNIDAEPELAVRFSITSVPTLLVVQNREVVKQIFNVASRGSLVAALKDFL